MNTRARSLGPFPTVDFFLLWSGRLVSQLGDRFYGIALAWWVLRETGSATSMGLVMSLSLLPEIVLAVLAGPLIDRWEQKRILVVTDVLRGVAVLGVAALQVAGRLTLGGVMLSAVAISAASAFFNPTSQAVVARIVPEGDRPRANSLNAFTGGMTMIAGPLLGAAAVSTLGFTWVFAANAVSYFISGLLEAGVEPLHGSAGRTSVVGDLREGFAFLWAQRGLRRVIVVIGVAHFFWGSFMVCLPILASRLSGDGVRNLGALETAIGLGLVAGAAVSSARRLASSAERGLFARLSLFGAIFVAVAGLLWLSVRAVPPYVVTMLAYGMVVAGASVLWQSLMQRQTPGALAGRVFSVSSLVADVAVPVAYAVFGVVLESHAIGTVFFANGVALTLLGVALLARSARMMSPPEAAPAAD